MQSDRLRRWPAAVGAVAAGLVLLTAACGDDGGGEGAVATTTTATLDPGVTFPDTTTTTAPAATPGSSTTTTAPAQVESVPGEVPGGFPADFFVPEGAVVEVGSSGRAQGERRFAVDYRVDASPRSVHQDYQDALDTPGVTVLVDDESGSGDDYVAQLVFETDAYVGSVLIGGDGAGATILTLTATLPD